MAGKHRNIGKVVLASAGPGDPELITVKAVRSLQEADVVITDRLVSVDILRKYVTGEVPVIFVGKQGCKASSVRQKDINQLLVDYARQGKSVVRLKGGDAAVFSNILDELVILEENQIPYEIIPGVTAASGAAVFAGFPLTARGYATAVRFLTLYDERILTDDYWQCLALSDDTLVFYMSSQKLKLIADKLLEAGMPADRHIAVVEQATTPFQRVYKSELAECCRKWEGKEFISPSLIIIGKVVALHEKFAWLEANNQNDAGYYFAPLD